MSGNLYFLIGPTAVGKTALSLEWAERLNAEILSCDSLLFYRGMDIGTAKPSPAELSRVPHHLVDCTEISAPMNLPRYLERVESCVSDIASRGKRVLVTGGSGFYLQSFFQPVPQEMPADREARRALEILEAEEGLRALLQALDRIHPTGTPGLDRNNPRRVFNALLRSQLLQIPWDEMRAQWEGAPPPLPGWGRRLVRLDRPEGDLHRRIEIRVRQMLDHGLVEEVRHLESQGIRDNPTTRSAIGYREILTEPHAGAEAWCQAICQNTRRLVRKQEQWFRQRFRHLTAWHPEILRRYPQPESLFR